MNEGRRNMPIRLCDGNAYTISSKIEPKREWVLSFFLDGHIEDYLFVYNETGQYEGMITYHSLLKETDIEGAIIYEKLFIGDGIWDNARKLIQDNKDGVLPVFNKEMECLFFAKYDPELNDVWNKLRKLRKHLDKQLWTGFQHYEKYIHIKGFNEVLYFFREWMISLGTEISVESEVWKAFGIQEKAWQDKNIVIVDEKCKWIDSLYLEYCIWLDNYASKLKRLVYKPFVNEPSKKEIIMFFLTAFPYFVDNISSLIFRYIQSGKECIFVFPDIKQIMDVGFENIDRMVDVIEKLEAAGGKCYDVNEQGLYVNEYAICFLCSEYSGRLPLALRRLSRYVVAIQVTALYIHMYGIKERFEEVFSEQARNEIDYLIASDYIANWICERDNKWDNKILRFGYPKLDTMYYALKGIQDIPKEWKKKTFGKKVYLFTTYNIEQGWLEYFSGKEDNKVAIWRPHPLRFTRAGEKQKIMQMSEKYNIIIDDTLSYYAAFDTSDALISAPFSSVMVNYLYTGKPVCIYLNDTVDAVYKLAEQVCQQEAWYQSAYIGQDEEGVLEFMKMIGEGLDVRKEELAVYRKHIINHFDGAVCNRIYDYFDNLKRQ